MKVKITISGKNDETQSTVSRIVAGHQFWNLFMTASDEDLPHQILVEFIEEKGEREA